jgi:diaminopimelate decarboxylase
VSHESGRGGATLHVSGATSDWAGVSRLAALVTTLRATRPGLEVIPVGYGASDPAHLALLPGLLAMGDWAGIDEPELVEIVHRILNAGMLWLADHGAEAALLSDAFGERPGLLAPPTDALLHPTRRVELLASEACLERYPVLVAAWGEHAIHGFGREWGWNLEIEGPPGVLARTTDRRSAAAAIARAGRWWPLSTLEIRPSEEALGVADEIKISRLALSAHRGLLLDTCVLGEDAGEANFLEPDADFATALATAVRRLHWTGGAEIEVVWIGERMLLRRWTAGFPVWAGGAAIAGHDGPGRLVTVALHECEGRGAVPPADEPAAQVSFGEPSTEDRLVREAPRGELPELEPAALIEELDRVALGEFESPSYHFLPDITTRLWSRALTAIQASDQRPGPRAAVAYSIKTNPLAAALISAREAGFLAEAISQLEADWAQQQGYTAGDIVLNGPGKWWPAHERGNRRMLAAFADSLYELADLVADGPPVSEIIGVRLRPSVSDSRFGVPVGREGALREAGALLRRAASYEHLGVSFHVNSHWVGWRRWWSGLDEVLAAAAEIEHGADRPIDVVDVGGGWFPDDWYRELLPRLAEVEERVTAALPHVERLFLEPGKALVQPTMALVTRVLEVRHDGCHNSEVVVDASVAELQAALAYPRRRAWRRRDGAMWMTLLPGTGRLLGRLCMENDIVGIGVRIPAELVPGDWIAFGDAGAYDMSMSYGFARGGVPGAGLVPTYTYTTRIKA